ncbi:MAG: tetratricopeptide repeat protein [Pseudomonadota bacterium]
MRNVGIQVVSAPSRYGEGAAAIRLRGIPSLPRDVLYRLEPFAAADTSANTDAYGWPEGNLKPQLIRQIGSTAEVIIPSDVAGAPALKPGTPVAFVVPSLGLRREFRWPRLDGAHAASAEASGTGATVGPHHTARPASEDRGPDASDAPAPTPLAHAAPRDRADTAPRKTTAARELNATAPPAPAHPATQTTNSAATTPNPRSQLATLQTEPPRATPIGQTAPVLHAPRSRPRAARDETAPPPPPRVTVPAADNRPQFPQSDTARLQVEARDNAIRRHGRTWLTWFATLALGAGLATAVLVGAFLAVKFDQPWVPAPVQAALSTGGGQTAFSVDRLADILKPPTTSPSGRDAQAVASAEALRLADTHMNRGSSADDQAEAMFWLRRALGLELDRADFARASTQLATLYAAPANGAPDYRSARLLWELAAARGDASAMCFLATLYQQGLGVPRNIEKAVGFYAMAAKAGGGEIRPCARQLSTAAAPAASATR